MLNIEFKVEVPRSQYYHSQDYLQSRLPWSRLPYKITINKITVVEIVNITTVKITIVKITIVREHYAYQELQNTTEYLKNGFKWAVQNNSKKVTVFQNNRYSVVLCSYRYA